MYELQDWAIGGNYFNIGVSRLPKAEKGKKQKNDCVVIPNSDIFCKLVQEATSTF